MSRGDHRVKGTGFVDDVRTFPRQATVYICRVFDVGATQVKILDVLSMGIPVVATECAVRGGDKSV